MDKYLINMQLFHFFFFFYPFQLRAFGVKLHLLSLQLDIKDYGRSAAIYFKIYTHNFRKTHRLKSVLTG